MTMHVDGKDIHDVRSQLGGGTPGADIKISFRTYDYGRLRLPGCIVDATPWTTRFGRVPREFDTAADALKYIGEILHAHDKAVADDKREEQRKERAEREKQIKAAQEQIKAAQEQLRKAKRGG